MNWFEQIEALLAKSRQTGRAIEFRLRGPNGEPGSDPWQPIIGVVGFSTGYEYRLTELRHIRPFTLAEWTHHFGKQIVRVDINGGFGPSYVVDSIVSDGIRIYRDDMIPGYDYKVLCPGELANRWHFFRDGGDNTTTPPCGVPEVIPASEPINATVTYTSQAMTLLDLDRAITDLNEARGETKDLRARFYKLMTGIKAALGYEHWPDFEGDHVDNVIGLITKHQRDWSDSVANCLRAVGLDPGTADGEALIRGYGTRPSDAVRGRYMEQADTVRALKDAVGRLMAKDNSVATIGGVVPCAPDLRIPNQPEPACPRVVRFNVYDVAKDAAERASINAASSDRTVPPELLFGPITFALWDAFGVNGWREPVGPVQVVNITPRQVEIDRGKASGQSEE